eukprot:457600-Rhodomonas_salina.4
MLLGDDVEKVFWTNRILSFSLGDREKKQWSQPWGEKGLWIDAASTRVQIWVSASALTCKTVDSNTGKKKQASCAHTRMLSEADGRQPERHR